MQLLELLLKKAMLPRKLPEKEAGLEKRIDEFLLTTIRKLEHLRNAHRQHVQHQGAKSTLRKKLADKEALTGDDASGGSFHRLLQEISGQIELTSPYSLSSDELEKRIEAVAVEAEVWLRKVEEIWDSKPKSSEA